MDSNSIQEGSLHIASYKQDASRGSDADWSSASVEMQGRRVSTLIGRWEERETNTAKLGTSGRLTVGVFERLLLLGRLGDDLDALAVEDADVLAVAVEHLHRQHKVFALVRVGDEERLGRAIALQ